MTNIYLLLGVGGWSLVICSSHPPRDGTCTVGAHAEGHDGVRTASMIQLPSLGPSVDFAASHDDDMAIRIATLELGGEASSTTNDTVLFGNPKCKCIGVDYPKGEVAVPARDKTESMTVSYPAKLGSSCQAWDLKRHPRCMGEPVPAWCKQKWCYVDPCECRLNKAVPARSKYFAEARWKGNPLHVSYATCGDHDLWANDKALCQTKGEPDCKKVHDCSWDGNQCVSLPVSKMCENKSEKHDPCPCVGITGRNGSVEALAQGKAVKYPIDVGSHCQAWDSGRTPKCLSGLGSKNNSCEAAYCYVDPCRCDKLVFPMLYAQLGNATVNGHEIFFSYEACDSKGDKLADIATMQPMTVRA